MHYYSTTLATDIFKPDWRVRIFYLLFFFVPRANPDFEPLFPRIRRWYVEVDEAGESVRELGLDEQGTAITAGPWKRNFGFWTDSPGPFPADMAEPLSQAQFEQAWASIAGNRGGA